MGRRRTPAKRSRAAVRTFDGSGKVVAFLTTARSNRRSHLLDSTFTEAHQHGAEGFCGLGRWNLWIEKVGLVARATTHKTERVGFCVFCGLQRPIFWS